MAYRKITHTGFILLTYLTVPVYSELKQCFYTIAGTNNNDNPGLTRNKDCFYGCCSRTSYDPCCSTPVNDNSLGPGAIGGIIIGVIIALIILVGAIVIVIRYNKKKNDGDKYMTPAKPAVSYITTSEVTDVTDLSRLPPIARYDEDKDYPDSTSYRSNKSDAYSQRSEPRQYSRPNQLPINQKPVRSTSSMDSGERPPSYNNSRPTRRQNAPPSYSSIDSLDHPPRHHSPRQHSPRQHSRNNPPSMSSTGSRDHGPKQGRPRQHSSNYANSTSSVDSREHHNRSVSERQSVTSNADSIVTTV